MPASSALATITTTYRHPFYDVTQAKFVEAVDLRVGDHLQTADGAEAVVEEVTPYHSTEVTYDLTIGELHTYYVYAGDVPVLVYNCGGGVDASGAACGCPSPRPTTWHLDAIEHPDTAIHAAEQSGDGSMLTIDRPGSSQRRADNLRDVETSSGLDRDEFSDGDVRGR
jgi:hypothetical protein